MKTENTRRSNSNKWRGKRAGLDTLRSAVVSIVATALMPDYTNKDISEEHDRP